MSNYFDYRGIGCFLMFHFKRKLITFFKCCFIYYCCCIPSNHDRTPRNKKVIFYRWWWWRFLPSMDRWLQKRDWLNYHHYLHRLILFSGKGFWGKGNDQSSQILFCKEYSRELEDYPPLCSQSKMTTWSQVSILEIIYRLKRRNCYFWEFVKEWCWKIIVFRWENRIGTASGLKKTHNSTESQKRKRRSHKQ